MPTTVYFIRNAETAWNAERRLVGRRELGLSEPGRVNAASLVERFAGVTLDELLVSPLPRAVETGEPLAISQKLELARDPRLADWQAGDWEARTYDEITADPRYPALLGPALDGKALPNGERFTDVVARMTGSVHQALEDNELGAHIAIVSHAGPLRLMLSHYLSIPVEEHARLRTSPAGVTVLRFSSLDAPPSLVALDLRGRVLDSLSVAR